MTDLLLQTKLYRPFLRPFHLPRPHLLQKLNHPLPRKLTLIAAPAGFGKTTLVLQWLHQLTIDNRPLSIANFPWLTLDSHDNDPTRFLTYLIAALQTAVHPHLSHHARTLLQSGQPTPAQTILTLLLNELASQTEPIFLILDDYHNLTNPYLHEAIQFFIEHLPPTLHLILTTRSEPPLSLPRWRVRGEVVDIRADDLRFTAVQTQTLLTQQHQLTLTDTQAAQLQAQTEGWIAGIQMAALTLPPGGQISQFLQNFSGEQRHIFDYLSQEVLNHLPQATQDFLLQTAVLDQLCAPLCDFILAIGDWRLGESISNLPSSPPPTSPSQQTLTQLEQTNLFLIPLDQKQIWFRYHTLLHDFLRARLRASQFDQTALHQRAATWFAANNMSETAVSHHLAAHDTQAAAHLISQIWYSLLERGQIITLQQLLSDLPETAVTLHPDLQLAQAWCALSTGQYDNATAILTNINLQSVSNTLRGRILAAQATIAATQRHIPQTITLAEAARPLLPASDTLQRSILDWNLAFAYRRQGELTRSEQAYQQAAAIAQQGQHLAMRLLTLAGLGNLYFDQGQLALAQQQYQQCLTEAGFPHNPLPLALDACIGLTQLFYERNQLEDAAKMAQTAVSLCHTLNHTELEAATLREQAAIQLAQGQTDEAMTTIHTAVTLLQTRPDSRYQQSITAMQATLHLHLGDVATAAQLSQSHDLFLLQARVLLAQGQFTAVLDHLRQNPAQSWIIWHKITVLLLQAQAHWRLGDEQTAVHTLQHALTLAAPTTALRIIADEGPNLLPILHQAQTAAPAYVAQLLAIIDAKPSPITSPPQLPSVPPSTLIEPLSDRELEILRLMADGLTNQQIADRLILSLTTIKWHARNIYSKLNVRNRGTAVAHARTLNLL
ncbi:MAG: tetratricopeptide repeat protein [Ardenticatenaceae bacterium]|nr:tetratricopeptide repeat protein [Ardenticatenaceae bacterium]